MLSTIRGVYRTVSTLKDPLPVCLDPDAQRARPDRVSHESGTIRVDTVRDPLAMVESITEMENCDHENVKMVDVADDFFATCEDCMWQVRCYKA